ncbi:MAG: bifunctional glutamate N-acetyltransferase/amino-acid acetyltransferase ArgJ [Methylobacteriaceae bacterium]|jgi:glutamate N-acetyltransferase/amino-acid N-acetyltransferase|nr:bifunctional glutamate N-acetyltransferase/amino-acid acetyltransferase ArgJ [Methylobacteriaceae bacterium]
MSLDYIRHTGGVTLAKGFYAGSTAAGIKKSGKPDLGVIFSEFDAVAAGVFTLNKVVAAPVIVSRAVAAAGKGRAIVVNAGCANACTGADGLADAHAMAQLVAAELNIDATQVFVNSTGVIGQKLPMDKVAAGIHDAVAGLSAEGSGALAEAILTTDTFAKQSSLSFTLGGETVHIGGIAKGSGMIHPNMATTLCFVTTDAAVTAPLLQKALKTAADKSFNMITVDGDTSTNDSIDILANGAAGNPLIDTENAGYAAFLEALTIVLTDLAKMIARDGEGATKFLTIAVTGAKSFADAKTIGMSVARSPLVKTAFFGCDANWGRILAAVGYAGADMDPDKTVVAIENVVIYDKGIGASDSPELDAAMAQHDITISIDLNLGEAEATVWTCDLSHDYVRINGDYRS